MYVKSYGLNEVINMIIIYPNVSDFSFMLGLHFSINLQHLILEREFNPQITQITQITKNVEPIHGKPRGVFHRKIHFITASCRELNPIDSSLLPVIRVILVIYVIYGFLTALNNLRNLRNLRISHCS